MKKIGVIFDLDGTLIDSGPDLTTAVNLTLTELGLAPMASSEVAKYLGHGPGRLIRDVMGPEYAHLAERAFPIFNRHYTEHLVEGTFVFPGIRECLNAWVSRAHLGVVTNKEQSWTDELLQRLDLAFFFDPVFGHGALPEHKPAPGPLFECARRWGRTASECVMVGDSEVDIQAGRAAGMWVVGVTWGNRPPESIHELHPDFVVDDAMQLQTVFQTIFDAIQKG